MTDRESQDTDAGVDPVRVSAGFFRRAGSKWERVGVADRGAEVLFGVQCRAPAGSSHQLVVQLWRGQRLRDRRVQQFEIAGDAPWRATYRVSWGQRPAASSRLRCGLQLDQRHVGWWELLLQDLSVDAQGRLSGDTQHAASQETVMLYQREYAALLGRRVGE